MKILLDTNVFLDVLLERVDWVESSQATIDWCEANSGSGWVSWHTLSNLYYIGSKLVGSDAAGAYLDMILKDFQVCPVSTETAKVSRRMRFADYEDAMQAACALSAGVDRIVTRNVADFEHSPIEAISPDGFVKTTCDPKHS